MKDNSKIRILFICHGNICRSPMAEFVMRHLCRTNGVDNLFEIASAAVSTEEIGNDIYPPAKRKLSEKNIPFSYHSARQITLADYDYYDYIICADSSNIRWLQRIINKDTYEKVSLMMSWAGKDRDVSDPWYTGDFEAAYRDISLACESILKRLVSSTIQDVE